ARPASRIPGPGRSPARGAGHQRLLIETTLTGALRALVTLVLDDSEPVQQPSGLEDPPGGAAPGDDREAAPGSPGAVVGVDQERQAGRVDEPQRAEVDDDVWRERIVHLNYIPSWLAFSRPRKTSHTRRPT